MTREEKRTWNHVVVDHGSLSWRDNALMSIHTGKNTWRHTEFILWRAGFPLHVRPGAPGSAQPNEPKKPLNSERMDTMVTSHLINGYYTQGQRGCQNQREANAFAYRKHAHRSSDLLIWKVHTDHLICSKHLMWKEPHLILVSEVTCISCPKPIKIDHTKKKRRSLKWNSHRHPHTRCNQPQVELSKFYFSSKLSKHTICQLLVV